MKEKVFGKLADDKDRRWIALHLVNVKQVSKNTQIFTTVIIFSTVFYVPDILVALSFILNGNATKMSGT